MSSAGLAAVGGSAFSRDVRLSLGPPGQHDCAKIQSKVAGRQSKVRRREDRGATPDDMENTELKMLTSNFDFNQDVNGSPASSPVNEPDEYDKLNEIGKVSSVGMSKGAPPPCAFRPLPTRAKELQEELEHMREKEATERRELYKVCPDFHNYMDTVQKNQAVTVHHRRTVFEWNLKLADNELRLSNQALHYAFAYFDQYLSRMPCPREQLQLVSTAAMWIASKICSSECPVAKTEQLEEIVGINREEIKRMECWLLASLKWHVQPVTTYDIVHLLLPFMFCEYKYRAKLVQYVENITLAQALVFPLLKYEPSVLAVTAVVCGAHLVVKQTHKDVSMDEGLNNGLAELCGVEVERTLQCRREVVQFINLDNLVLTNVEAQAIMAERSKKRQERLRRRKDGEFHIPSPAPPPATYDVLESQGQ